MKPWGYSHALGSVSGPMWPYVDAIEYRSFSCWGSICCEFGLNPSMWSLSQWTSPVYSKINDAPTNKDDGIRNQAESIRIDEMIVVRIEFELAIQCNLKDKKCFECCIQMHRVTHASNVSIGHQMLSQYKKWRNYEKIWVEQATQYNNAKVRQSVTLRHLPNIIYYIIFYIVYLYE